MTSLITALLATDARTCDMPDVEIAIRPPARDFSGDSVLPARRYASAGISCRRVSVCLSVTRPYFVETDAGMGFIFHIQVSLDPYFTVL